MIIEKGAVTIYGWPIEHCELTELTEHELLDHALSCREDNKMYKGRIERGVEAFERALAKNDLAGAGVADNVINRATIALDAGRHSFRVYENELISRSKAPINNGETA